MGDMKAILHTNHGDITVDLFPDHAPKTVANFADLAEGRNGHGLDFEGYVLSGLLDEALDLVLLHAEDPERFAQLVEVALVCDEHDGLAAVHKHARELRRVTRREHHR